jgi:hypothetical protein
VILRFPYLSETLQGPPPPSLPKSTLERWRPIVPIIAYGPLGTAFTIYRALVDPGSDDTIFPLSVASALGIPLLAPTGHAMRWRGQRVALRFGVMELELVDPASGTLRWPATVAFTVANVRYPLLGMCGFLEFLDVKFLGKDRMLEVEPNASLPVTA